MMMKLSKRYWLMTCFASLLACLGVFISRGDTVKAAETNLVVTPVYTDNQIGGHTGYFNTYVAPGETQTYTFLVANKSDDKRTLYMRFNAGYTNQSGNAVFDSTKIPADSSLKYDMAKELLVGNRVKRVHVEGQETGTVSFEVKAPSTAYNGVIMGGVVTSTSGKSSLKSDGTLLKNDYGYAIPIFIRNQQEVSVSPKITLGTVKPAMRNGSPAVLVQTKNEQPAYLTTSTITAKVYRKGESKVYKKSTNSAITMAPNSNFEYGIDWGKNRVEAGDYKLDYTVSQGKLKTWHFTKNFTISNDDAKRLNDLAGFKPNYTWLWILLAVVVLIVILLIGILVGRRNKKNNNSNGNNNANGGKDSRRSRK
ncbi:DUF916 and DUF3324 domain-containing protein [Agrilactobacillus yilanensis]|uniref:DUF916 and DUF3324 domain-containing protein n=2 Tax=Agrilactobacillus yilanensis TaxID=2485997 RepID=A0ABW4J6F5_9LACO